MYIIKIDQHFLKKKDIVLVNKVKFQAFILMDDVLIKLQEYIIEKIDNFHHILKDKKHIQSFLEVVNFEMFFIKIFVKYRKDFTSLV